MCFKKQYMKQLFLTAFLFVIGIFPIFSQLSEGHIQYDLTVNMSEDDPKAQMMASMMEGSTLEMFFRDQNSRSEVKMGKMMQMTIISDAKSGDILTLMSGMIGKKAIQSNINDSLNLENNNTPEYKIEFFEETKIILGYTCQKSILTSEDGREMIAWYTEDLSVYKKGLNYMNEQIPGVPLEFEMDMNGMIMLVKASKIEKMVPDNSLFDMTIPAGYEIVDPNTFPGK